MAWKNLGQPYLMGKRKMKSAKNIKQYIKKLNINSSDQIHSRVLDKLVKKLDNSKTQSVIKQPNTWRIIMQSKIAKLAAAVVIIATVAIGLNRCGIKVDMSSPAFADVLEQVKKATSVYYKENFQVGDNSWSQEMMINENGVKRLILNKNMVMLFDSRNGINLTLDSKTKRGFRTVIKPRPEMKLFNSLDFLATRHEKGISFVGNEIIDGKETRVYEDIQPLQFSCTTIWVDPETDLPVRVVSETIPPDDPNYFPIKMLSLYSKDFGDDNDMSCGGNLCGNCTPRYTKKVMTDFQWNIDLDTKLFDTEIPEDYEKHEEKLSQPDETYLIEALKFWSEMSDGLLPIDVNDLMDPNTIEPMFIKKFKKGQNPYQEYNNAADFMDTFRWGAIFAERKIVSQKNWHASKESVYFGQADKPLYWWQIEDSNNYQVIYGDLTIDEVAEDEIP